MSLRFALITVDVKPYFLIEFYRLLLFGGLFLAFVVTRMLFRFGEKNINGDVVMKREMNPVSQGLYDPSYEHDACGVGFVCHVKGEPSHDIVRKGLRALVHLSHRGATGSDPKTGDGAGILVQMPYEFFEKVTVSSGITLPKRGSYAAGNVFLPTDESARAFCKKTFETIIKAEGCEFLGWREVPVDNSDVGITAREVEPITEQIFVGKPSSIEEGLAFERKLYVIRKQVEHIVRRADIKQISYFYVSSLSSRTMVYKGQLMAEQVDFYFPDLADESFKSALALVHSRYSTNTFPTWDLAHPFRFLAHNGEINTLRGNINWMFAREGLFESEVFGDDIKKIEHIIMDGGSDSAMLDNAFELLALSGRSLAHSIMMMIPAAWENNDFLDEKLKAFYKYHACITEPWDGPAAVAFTDGKSIGGILDRNGLRPARYILTKDGLLVMASEVGVLDIPFENIAVSGRIEPGKIFLVDTEEGRIITDEELKKQMAERVPYGDWLKENLVDLDNVKDGEKTKELSADESLSLMKSFGYTREDMKFILKPMAEDGVEPTGAMGNDTPPSILSERPQLLYTYFKQLFAQVTNPAIDPIREEIVMSYELYAGPQKNLLAESAQHAHRLRIGEPVLTNEAFAKIRDINEGGFKTKIVSTLFDTADEKAFNERIDAICAEAEKAIDEGYSFVALSDRGISKTKAALPAMLALGAVHQYLVKKSLRTQIGIVVESGEAREIHHFACLFGYGADAVNPYLAFAALKNMVDDKRISLDFETASKHYLKAVRKGIFKILSKMGISTLQSYRGAQIFEALGVSDEVMNKCFTGTASRIGGVTFSTIRKETLLNHSLGFPEKEAFNKPFLQTGGLYQWKKDGEYHMWNPDTIATLQQAVQKEDYSLYKTYSEMINDQSKHPGTLRGMLKFNDTKAIDIDEVESAENIYKRLATGAMSFGSISRGAHEGLAIIMNRLGGRSNTGEGGEDPARFTPLPNGDSARSAVKQIASGRFGVTTNYLTNSDEIQIKIAQGAKPGEGGQLPGHKVSAIIARTRYTTPGVTLISPPPHHDIYSIEDLAQLIFDLKNVNPRARISVKLVSEVGVGTIAAGVAKGHADMILISGGDGGTGSSPLTSIKHAGLPWELGLSETHQTLVLNNLRTRTRIQTDGQMRTGRDMALAALLGAEEFGFATLPLIFLGCVMLRHCTHNNCSVGVATQDPILQERFRGRIEHGVTYFKFAVHELREIMASLGIRTIDEMVGRADLLSVNKDILPWKAKDIDYSKILYKPEPSHYSIKTYKTMEQEHGVDAVLDKALIELAKDALEERKEVKIEHPIQNINRTVGAMLSGEICRRYGDAGLVDDTIHCKFTGEAGQSFGAWLAKGVTFELEGLCNDYIGKGISGGRIIVYPSKKADYVAEDNYIIGNTSFYGAILGEAYIRGRAGERFCIRNSGLNGVVEGVGDHGCEYMTGGNVVILGTTGRNFGAGMSGGIAYVYDEDGLFSKRCNMGMVEFAEMDKEAIDMLHTLLHNHYKYTESPKAKGVLDNFNEEIKKFIKVLPLEYKRILEMRAGQKKLEESDA